MYSTPSECSNVLFERKRDRESGERERKGSHPVFTPWIPTTAGAGPGLIQGPGTWSESPMWVARTQILKPLPVAFQAVTQKEVGLKVELELKPRDPVMRSVMRSRCPRWLLNHFSECLCPGRSLPRDSWECHQVFGGNAVLLCNPRS